MPARNADLANTIRVLQEQAHALANLNGTSAEERLASYQAWASQASGQLRYVFDLAQVEELINTQRHDFLIAKSWADTQLLINNSISAEQADRARVFQAVLDGLRDMERSCKRLPKFLVVPDTNIFLHQEKYFDELDWYEMVGVGADFRVTLPMAIVRELDKSKRTQAGKRVSETNDEQVRTRARVSSRRLRELFASPHDVREFGKRGSIEMLFDPVGHRHLDDPDMEIIDRAVALRTVSGRKVFVLTGDGNMQFMAGIADLDVIALPD